MRQEQTPSSAPALARRLKKNRGRYGGDTIAIRPLLEELHSAALREGWQSDDLCQVDGLMLRAYHRPARSTEPFKLYLSSGIHGDEPAGPTAMLQLVQGRWPDSVALWMCPCLNPSGFEANRRENNDLIDLNRDYRQPKTSEVKAHVQWLERQPNFDLSLLLHEDWEAEGFYLYELNAHRNGSLAPAIIESVGTVCPIENGHLVDGWQCVDGVIRPDVAPESRPTWPEAIYLWSRKTPRSYTLEAPSDYALSVRVAALVNGVQAVLRSVGRSATFA